MPNVLILENFDKVEQVEERLKKKLLHQIFVKKNEKGEEVQDTDSR